MARIVGRVLAVFVAVLGFLLGTAWLQYGTEQGTSLFGPGPFGWTVFHVLAVGSVVGALGWTWRANWRRRVAVGSLIVVWGVLAFTVGVSGGGGGCHPVGFVNPDYAMEYHWAENTLEYGAYSDRCRTTPHRTVAVAGYLLTSVGILVGGRRDGETPDVA